MKATKKVFVRKIAKLAALGVLNTKPAWSQRRWAEPADPLESSAPAAPQASVRVPEQSRTVRNIERHRLHPEQPERPGEGFRRGAFDGNVLRRGFPPLSQDAASDLAARGFAEAGLRKTGT